jgi:hypothetical protein
VQPRSLAKAIRRGVSPWAGKSTRGSSWLFCLCRFGVEINETLLNGV